MGYTMLGFKLAPGDTVTYNNLENMINSNMVKLDLPYMGKPTIITEQEKKDIDARKFKEKLMVVSGEALLGSFITFFFYRVSSDYNYYIASLEKGPFYTNSRIVAGSVVIITIGTTISRWTHSIILAWVDRTYIW